MGRTDSKKCKPNELILIFQTIKENQNYSKGTYLTHLVTPVDNVPHENIRSEYPFSRLVTVVAKNQHPIPKPINLNFHKPNRGWLCDIGLIEPMRSAISLTRDQKQETIWRLFNIIDPSLKEASLFALNDSDTEIIDGVTEGAEKFAIGKHKYYERNPTIVAEAKRKAIKENRLKCEVCQFDFDKEYKGHGTGFIECHHTIPIATGGIRQTKVEDLGMVCANCHRMLHRKNATGTYYTIPELKLLITKSN